MEKEEIKIRLAFYALFGVLGAFILLTPHLIAGHIFIVEEKYAQSLILFIDMVVGYLFYKFYQRKMKILHSEKAQAEKRLTTSYGYIGKVNNIIDIFKRFGRVSSQDNAEITEKEIFNILLSNIVVTVAKSDRGFLRFIDVKSGRTVKEFYFSNNGNDLRVRVSNAAILEQNNNYNKEFSIIESDYKNTGICCILCIPNTENIDVDLIKSLLNQAHLLYLVFNKKNTNKNYGAQTSQSQKNGSLYAQYGRNGARP